MTDDLDSQSEALAIRLMLEDIDSLKLLSKGKAKTGGPVPDKELVWSMQEMEAQLLSISLEDRRMAISLARSLETDTAILQAFAQQDELESRDRELAIAVSNGGPLPTRGYAVPIIPDGVDESLDVPKGASVDSDSDSEKDRPRATTSRIPVTCVICYERVSGVIIVTPCGHSYDTECISELFTRSITDETLFPPRCCGQDIPMESVKNHFDYSFRVRFAVKSKEFRTVNRLYCPNPQCSLFLGSASKSERGIITCRGCLTKVCTLCRLENHPDEVPCENDSSANALLALAETEGWKRCPGCHRIVELAHGCYHMTCLCRAQFCYLCTATWKQCRCPQWDENRLYRAAHQQVRNEHRHDGGGARMNAQALRHEVQERMAALRENHECRHGNWRVEHGRLRCEHCHVTPGRYLLRCLGCQIMVCVRCQRNRL